MLQRLLFLCVLSAGLVQSQGRYKWNDGDDHGDPPYLIEQGWTALFNGPSSLSGWQGQDGKPLAWISTTGVVWERLLGPTRLSALPAQGDRLMNGPNGRVHNIVTSDKFGDVELYVEFLISKGSNSGVYLHGLYEVQILDSYGSSEPMRTSDAGGIYHKWIDEQGVGGSAPSRNASRRPGEWQSFHIWFRAPRFDGSGKKTENAKFIRVLHNGLSVQDNVEINGPTRAAMNLKEAPLNPIMLQGDHGQVAFRNIYVRPLQVLVNR